MQIERAYTHLDSIRVCLANNWLTREWSTLLGHTTSLRQTADDFEWLSTHSPELRIVCGGEPLGILDLGAPDWSEEQFPAGASVVARYSGHALALTLWTMALHDHAALYRGGSLLNTSTQPVHLDEICLEIIPLLQAVCEEDRFTPPSAPWPSGGGFIIKRPGRCLVAACEHPIAADVSDTAGECCFRLACNRSLEPGEHFRLPELLMVFALGTQEAVLGRAYPNAVRTITEHRARREEHRA